MKHTDTQIYQDIREIGFKAAAYKLERDHAIELLMLATDLFEMEINKHYTEGEEIREWFDAVLHLNDNLEDCNTL